MSQDNKNTIPSTTNNRWFAAVYNKLGQSKSERSFMEPVRRKTAGRAHGIVLEVGAGTGLNFAFYEPGQVERVEAVEPDTAMLRYARSNLEAARVPITLTQAPVEALPFPDETFDSVVVTLVFCSVTDQVRGLAEVRRVLKPGGTLLMLEHVRSNNAFFAWIQDRLVPITKYTSGNCHWNRDTIHSVVNTGFTVTRKRDLGGLLLPMVLLQATK